MERWHTMRVEVSFGSISLDKTFGSATPTPRWINCGIALKQVFHQSSFSI